MYIYIITYIFIFVLCHNWNILQYVDILTTSLSVFIMFDIFCNISVIHIYIYVYAYLRIYI